MNNTPLEKAAKALQDYWDAVEEMNREDFDFIGNLTIKWGTSNFAIDHIKQDIHNETYERKHSWGNDDV